jgi:hypothetical protein
MIITTIVISIIFITLFFSTSNATKSYNDKKIIIFSHKNDIDRYGKCYIIKTNIY